MSSTIRCGLKLVTAASASRRWRRARREALEAQRHRDHLDDVRLVVDDQNPWAARLAHGLRRACRCRSNSIVACSVTFTNPPTLGAVIPNSLHGKVIEPTAWMVEPDLPISTWSVSCFETPWMLNAPVTGTFATVPVSKEAGSVAGLRQVEGRRRVAAAFQADFLDFFVAHRAVAVERGHGHLERGGRELVVLAPDCVKVALRPVIWDVRPTASLWAGRNASFSRTR